MKHILTIILFFTATIGFSNADFEKEEYLPNTLMIKVKDQYRSACSESGIQHQGILQALSSIEFNAIKKEFPNQQAPTQKTNSMGIAYADLSLIYRVNYSQNLDPKSAGAKLILSGYFEYADPFFLHQAQYNPNDPEISSQYHINTIKAYEAWDVAKGDTNVVIGISDTGIEKAHPDIAGNIKYNYNDPIDGVDNDGDGYIDNFYGWDTGQNDNDPEWNVSKHGHSVSGTAAAVTDNANQVAGVGFKTKILPIKITNSAQQLVGSYSSIIYAADHGCKIINCSWGTVNSWSQFGQDVITYAAINKECLVVCAAGNDNNEGQFYPASFDWALSVGGTNSSNSKWVSSGTYGSNYNEHVDICAPGVDIYTVTTGGSTISGRSGTSFSAPIVSGGAGLVWGTDTSYNGMQVGEILKATADSLEFIPGNGSYIGKLGEGLLNCERSVTETGFPGLYMYDFNFTSKNSGQFSPGDTVEIYGTLLNFLTSSSTATKVTLSSKSAFINIINPTITVGVQASGSFLDMNSTPFKVEVLPGMPVEENVGFIFTITDGTYNTKRYTEQEFNLDYVNVDINKVATSVGSSGKVAYNKLGVQSNGLGFTYNGSASILYHMGLVVANANNQVSYVLDGDFETESTMRNYPNGVEADQDVYTHFNDNPAAANKLNISVKQKTLAWTDVNYEDFVILEYKIFNNSGVTYNNLHVGMYADWDIGNAGNNDANFDATNNIAYTNEIGGVFGAIHLLTPGTPQHYAFNNDGTGGSFSIYDGFTEQEQYDALSSGNSRPTAGTGDVSQMIGNGPFTLANGDSLVFAVAVLAGDDVADVQNNALQSDTAYRNIRELDITLQSNNAPSCVGFCDGTASISVTGGVGSTYNYQWNDVLSQTTANPTGMCSGTYKCIVTDSIGNKDSITVVIGTATPVVVSLGNDVTICNGSTHTLDAGNPGATYLWSTGAISQQIVVSSANNYFVEVTTGAGCKGRDTINIFTGSTPIVALGNDTSICSGNTVTLDAKNVGSSYLWSNGATSQTQTFNSSGIYWVEVTNSSTCSSRDSLTLTVNTAPVVNLGNDINVCDTYSGSLDAGNPGATYQWSTSATSQSILVSNSGTYWVKVTIGGLCEARDTLILNIETKPVVDLGPDTIKACKSDQLVLDAGPAVAYLWNNGVKKQTNPAYFEGKYVVTAGTYCSVKDSTYVKFKSDPLVWSISSFNPVRNSAEGDVLLDFGQPLGGTYSGPAVTGNIFNTIASGNGLFKVDYNYVSPTTGCTASTWVAMDIQPTNSAFHIGEGSVNVFPNPFEDQFTINFSNLNHLNQVSYSLYDSNGKICKSDQLNLSFSDAQFVIQTNNLSNGIYHLVIENEEFKEIIKLVK